MLKIAHDAMFKRGYIEYMTNGLTSKNKLSNKHFMHGFNYAQIIFSSKD